jgi:4-amino-4-deoxy-L-arabinose transferase-like glycosyltransferase
MKFKTHIWFLLLIIITASIRLSLWNVNKSYWWDEAVYLGLGKNLAEGEGYKINVGDEKFRPPLLPFIISLFIKNGEWSARLISPIFGIISVFVTYLLAKKIYDKKTALISAFIVSSTSLYIFFGQKILTETLSLTLFTATLYFFHMSFKEKRYLMLTGIFFALSILIRYTNLLLFPIFIIYFLYMKKFDIIRKKEFFFSIILFIIVLSPWLYINTINYGDPLGALKDNLAHAPAEYSPGPVYYYILYSIDIFGFSIIFIIPFFILNKRKKSDILIIISIVLILLTFSIMGRKEIRYLLPYISVFSTASAKGALDLMNRTKDKFIIPIILSLIIFSGFYTGIQKTLDESSSGIATVQAAEYIKKIPSDYIFAENYAVINYISGKKVYIPPSDEEKFNKYVQEYNIEYLVVDTWDKVSPEYVKHLAEKSELLARFEEKTNGHAVFIYKIR